MTPLKRLLLVTYYYPPAPEAGALRPAYLERHLVNYGWATTIITPHSPASSESKPNSAAGTRRIRSRLSSSRLLRNLHQVLRTLIYFPDAGIFWLPRALRQATDALRRCRFDAVMSTALPGSVHIAGSYIRRTYQIPWVADYRDLWTSNPYRRFGPVRSALDRWLEHSVLRNADVITAVSENLVESLRFLAPQATYYAIHNAFDPADWVQIDSILPSEFRLCYGGRMYNGLRSPEPIFAAVAELKSSGDPVGMAVRFDFFGSEAQNVLALAAKYELESAVKVHGSVSRSEMLKAERNAAVLLLLLSRDRATADEFGSKIYEYMGARRPILAVGGDKSVVKTLLQTSGLGFYASSVEECKLALRQLFSSFQAGILEPSTSLSLESFTADRMAAQFAKALDTMVTESLTKKQS